jgi:hypothetical protein
MCWNAKLMSDFHSRLENWQKADYYRMVHGRYMEAIEKVSLQILKEIQIIPIYLGISPTLPLIV